MPTARVIPRLRTLEFVEDGSMPHGQTGVASVESIPFQVCDRNLID